MEYDHTTQNKIEPARHYERVMAFAVMGVLLIGVLVFLYYAGTRTEPENALQEGVVHASTSPFDRSAPTYLRIPAHDIEADFEEPLALNEDRTIEVPKSYEKVGWYELGVSPGEIGPAIVLGHVDSYEGPAVFYNLRELEKGDEIYIEREDGTTLVFEVVEKERYDQDVFPTQRVYGDTAAPELRLITCIGTYDHGTQRYSHNLVVYATLKEGAGSSPQNI